ncbi:MAG: hypothetical protein VKJ27_03385 [Synechocystis sp.]|nr:hypothetical protein [Synechocystis sp.]
MILCAIASQRGQGLSPEMSGSPIKTKFDEIVDFAEVERFLNRPVNRYLSGM